MRILLFLGVLSFLIISSHSGIAQVLTGQVLDMKGIGIAYSQIGVNGTSIYKLSDSEGKFSLNLPKSVSNRKLSFLAPGYKTASYSIDSLQNIKEVMIQLKEDVRQVTGTSIKSTKLKTRVKGNKAPPIGAMQMSLSQTHTSYGISQKVPGKKALLRSISFNVTNDTIIKFKVRPFVYAIIDNEPDCSKNLIPENRIFDYEIHKGWLTMDLSDIDVEVAGYIIFGVEWISVDGSSLTSMSLTLMGGRNSFERIGLQRITPYKGLGSYSIKGTFEFY